ncbi:unnamed protein product [Linum tenue]|uniref:Uncharacterized protein n=1 Tax=Linum tenue TaxID=586396 RepID=A0AAV0KG47_9ROSI|nr:unnamed protein product [Linum tenue]
MEPVVDDGGVGPLTKTSSPIVPCSLLLISYSTSGSQPLKQMPSYSNGSMDHGVKGGSDQGFEEPPNKLAKHFKHQVMDIVQGL